MNELVELRKKLMEHWDIIRTLGGDWNAGYEQALRYAMSLINDEVRKAELNNPKKKKEELHHYPWQVKPSKKVDDYTTWKKDIK